MSTGLLPGGPLVLTEENDYLGALQKVSFLKKFIETELQEGGLLTEENDSMIALYGGWGTGKSSVMKTLHESFVDSEEKVPNPYKLDEQNYKTVFFEAWKYEKDDNILQSLLDSISDELGIKFNVLEKVKQFILSTKHFAKAFKVSATVNDGNNTGEVICDVKDVIESLENEKLKKDINESLYRKVKKLEKNVKQIDFSGSKKLIVFIDDLDRCESENIINLLSAIKLFFTYIPNAIFVVGIDKDVVKLALKRRYHDDHKAEEYLEKVFGINFSLSMSYSVDLLVRQYFQDYPAEDQKTFFSFFHQIGFINPRHIKKLLNKYLVIKDHVFFQIGTEKKSLKDDIILCYIFLYYAILYEFYLEDFNYIENHIRDRWDSLRDKIKIINQENVLNGPTQKIPSWENLNIIKYFIPNVSNDIELRRIHNVTGNNKIENIKFIIENSVNIMLGEHKYFLIFLLERIKQKAIKEDNYEADSQKIITTYDALCGDIMNEVKRVF